jgi:hypothetical protein
VMWLGTQPIPPVMSVGTIPPVILIESVPGRHYCGERGFAQRESAAGTG